MTGLVVELPKPLSCGVAFPLIAVPLETVNDADNGQMSPTLLPAGPAPVWLHAPVIVGGVVVPHSTVRPGVKIPVAVPPRVRFDPDIVQAVQFATGKYP